MKESILFLEWVAGNHYIVYNIKQHTHYWINEENVLKTTRQLYKEFLNVQKNNSNK